MAPVDRESFDAWWRELCRRGDPARITGIEVLAFNAGYAAAQAKSPLTAEMLAKALDAFWDGSLNGTRRNRTDPAGTAAVASIADGVASVAQRLRGMSTK